MSGDAGGSARVWGGGEAGDPHARARVSAEVVRLREKYGTGVDDPAQLRSLLLDMLPRDRAAIQALGPDGTYPDEVPSASALPSQPESHPGQSGAVTSAATEPPADAPADAVPPRGAAHVSVSTTHPRPQVTGTAATNAPALPAAKPRVRRGTRRRMFAVAGLATEWRTVSAVVTALGVVIIAATFLPWFAIEVVHNNPPRTTTRTESGFVDTQFGYLVTAYGVCAVLLGLFCFFVKSATDQRLVPTLFFHLLLPIAGLVFAGISWAQASGDTSNPLTPAYGLLLLLVALVGWLVCGVLLRRMATAARGVPGSARN